MNLLGLVQTANTGLMVWETAGPLIEHFLAMGKGALDDITDEDLKLASATLGSDIDELHAAIEAKKLRDAG